VKDDWDNVKLAVITNDPVTVKPLVNLPDPDKLSVIENSSPCEPCTVNIG
jgi:hypothetical protein